ncbi:MAG: Fe-S cluster assembly protein SufD [Flavobacteriales bacterium]
MPDNPQQTKDFVQVFQNALGYTPIEHSFAKEAGKQLSITRPPGTKNELWKNTPVTDVLKESYSPSSIGEISAIDRFSFETHSTRIVFVNGKYVSALSSGQLPDGLEIIPLADAITNHGKLLNEHLWRASASHTNYFTLLNTAVMNEGVVVSIAPKAQLEDAVEFIFLTDGQSVAANVRNLLVAGDGSKARVINASHTINGRAFTNAVTEISLSHNSTIDYLLVQNEGMNSRQVNAMYVCQDEGSHFNALTLTIGGGLIRNDLYVELNGIGAETELNGLFLCKGRQHVDNHTHIDHQFSRCNSRELYKGVMDERSTAVFNGKVYVWPDAQKTNAFQSNRNILLSAHSGVFSKPELEIYADDVKCSHGSATGKLDEESVFYLRSRGIPDQLATKMLVRAFAEEITGNIKNPENKKAVDKLLDAWFHRTP